jgi:NADH-quinone oxidoreductase subunit K
MLDAMIPMEHYLIVSSIMFFTGVYGFIARKNMLAILISIELILNSVEINFSVFNRYLYPDHLEGMFFSLFGIAVSAAETAVAIAIIINIYRNAQNIDVRHVDKMKG